MQPSLFRSGGIIWGERLGKAIVLLYLLGIAFVVFVWSLAFFGVEWALDLSVGYLSSPEPY